MASVALLLCCATLSACGGGAADAQPAKGCSLQATAGCGGTLPDPVTPPITPPVTPPITPPLTPTDPAGLAAGVQLLFSSTELASAGLAGSEVGVTALVRDKANQALPGAAIAFGADSGLLSGVELLTDRNGQAHATLGTGGAPGNRNITVTATVGSHSGTGTVAVTGSSVEVSGPTLLTLGQQADLTLTVRDSARRPVAGAAVTLATSGAGNTLSVRDGGAALSNAQGQLALRLAAGALGKAALTVGALGATASHAYTVAGNELRITPAMMQDAGGAELLQEVPTGACQAIDVSYPYAGSASLSAWRGVLHADSACQTPLPASLAFANGSLPRSYIQSAHAGVATVTVAVAGGPTAQTQLEFVGQLGSASKLDLQAETAVLGASSAAAEAGAASSTLLAVVRDGPANNLVKHAPVIFSIVSDPSGGYLRQSGRVPTGADGVARAVYMAGANDSGRDGVLIEARIEGASQPQARAQVRLTVAKKALSIKFGSGNSVRAYSASVLQQDFAVFVADSAGNAVPGVALTATAWPSRYGKGYYVWEADKADFPDTGVWRLAQPRYSCANEDVLRNGLYEAAFDLNGNGVLDPGIPLTVSSESRTDALGLSTVTLSYPRNYGSWVQLLLTVRGAVAGSEAVASTEIGLPTLALDFANRRVAPPGQTSPYGLGPCSSAD